MNTTILLDGIALGGKSEESLCDLFWYHYDQIPMSFEEGGLLVCLDSPDSSKRIKKLHKVGYKANRKPLSQQYLNSFSELIDSFEAVGISYMVSPEWAEADDCICEIVASNPEQQYRIYTTDKDLALLQAIYPNAKTFIWERKTHQFIGSAEYVMLKFGVGLADFQNYLALVGDPSDDWVGLKGFGPVAFQKFLELDGVEQEFFLDDLLKRKGFSVGFAHFIVTPSTYAQLQEAQEAQNMSRV